MSESIKELIAAKAVEKLNTCPVRMFCTFKHCGDPDKSLFINPDNCTCRQCMDILPANRQCPVSGECHNTANECLRG